jgi:hypothetical protein
VKVKIGNQTIYVGSPSPLLQSEAEEIYQESLVDARFMEIMDDQELLDHLQDIGMWSIEDQQFMDDLPAKLESMKVEMYNNYSTFRSKRVEQIRRAIQRLMKDSYEIFSRRHVYDSFTSTGYAIACKLQFLVCNTSTDLHGNPININDDGNLVQLVVQEVLNSRVSETDLRELSRTDPWRTIWNAGKSEKQVFGVPGVLLTEDQKQLLSWSQLYDNVRESHESPDDTVMNDDLLLDGWLILQSRKAENEKKTQGGRHLSDKLSRANEVFLPVETREDAERVEQMNSAHARMVKRQRLKMVGKEAAVPEQYMPDAQLQIRQQALQEAKQHSRK